MCLKRRRDFRLADYSEVEGDLVGISRFIEESTFSEAVISSREIVVTVWSILLMAKFHFGIHHRMPSKKLD